MIGILISANVQNLCLNAVFPALRVSLFCGSAPIQRGELHLLKAHFRMTPSSDFPFAQLVEFPLDLQASVEVMLKLIIWSFQNQIPYHFA